MQAVASSSSCVAVMLCAAILSACAAATTPTSVAAPAPTPLASVTSAASETPGLALMQEPTDRPSPFAIPTIESLKATVTTDLLSCRYGPGPDYLFLYGLRKGANIVLVGRTDGANWRWVYVQGKTPCWVKADFLEVHGVWLSLPVVYPGLAKLPISPYYPPTTVFKATRQENNVTVKWLDIPLRAGDAEDASMQHYLVEVWHCVGGHLLFEPFGTNETSVTFIDRPGCSRPSHGRIFVQEKHGFAGPAEIPWPVP